MKPKIITCAIQKGGVGKTTAAAAIAQAAVFQGKKVLAIDLDPQGNLSYTLAAKDAQSGSCAFLEGAAAEEVLQRSPQGMDIIPAEWSLATVTSSKGSALRLRKALEPIKKDYDLIVIDVPSVVGEMQYNAFQASTGIVIPVLADGFSLKALFKTARTAQVMQGTNAELEITGILFTQYDQRSLISRDMRQQITDHAEAMNIPCLGAIRSAVAVREAALLQQSLFEYAPKSKPAQDYLEAFARIMK